jgi:hypothetical protein
VLGAVLSEVPGEVLQVCRGADRHNLAGAHHLGMADQATAPRFGGHQPHHERDR